MWRSLTSCASARFAGTSVCGRASWACFPTRVGAAATTPRHGFFRRRRGAHEDRALTRETAAPLMLASSTDAGAAITARTSLALADVWACVRVIAQTGGTLPVHAYRRLSDGSRERVAAPLLDR